MRVKLKDITKFSKGTQINGKNLIDDGAYSYLNGGIKPSGKWNEFNVAENTVTISEGGNSSGYVNYMNEAFWCGAHCYYLYDGPKNSKYLYYALKSQQERLFRIRSGACMPNIKKSDLGNFIIEYEEDETRQEEVVKVLEKCELLIEDYNKKLVLLDEAVRARFVEMFGDPEDNPFKWDKMPLSNIMLNANNGMARRGNDENGNIVLRLVELQDGYINYSNPNRICLNENEKKRYLLKNNDFLFARVNGNPDNVGRCAVFHDIGEDVYHNDHIIRVHFNEELLNGVFASELINSNFGKRQLKKRIKTSAGQYTVSQDGIGAIVSIVPPLELQNQFASFVQEIDKSRLLSNHSLFLIKSIIF